jgi:hypothetical protein
MFSKKDTNALKIPSHILIGLPHKIQSTKDQQWKLITMLCQQCQISNPAMFSLEILIITLLYQ